MRLASNLFHVGIIVIFFGHLFGMLTPHWVYSPFLHAGTKQLLAIVVGGVAGAMCLVGGAMLLHRRITNPRVRASSSTMDTLILGLIVFQAFLGMITILFSLGHMDGEMMLTLSSWAQSIVFFGGGAAAYMENVSWIYKLHIFLGLTIILRSEEHTSELQSRPHLVCRLLLEKKKKKNNKLIHTPSKIYCIHQPYMCTNV